MERTLVVCGVGHKAEPGYAVCKHVMDGKPAVHVIQPAPGMIGRVFCERVGHTAREIVVQCAECCRVRGWVPRDRRLGQQGIRAVLRDGDSGGYAVTLACGHTVWCAVDVTGWAGMYCGACLGELTDELRKMRKCHPETAV